MFIEIMETPEGEAPDWVRDAWIGCILPTRGVGAHPFVSGVVTGNLQEWVGYAVSLPEALQALEDRGQSTAAQWWREHSAPFDYELIFKAEGCREVNVPQDQERA